DGVFIYSITDNRFSYLNSAMVKILEINKKLLMDEPQLLLHSIPDEDQEYMQVRYAELLEKESTEELHVRMVQNKVEKQLSCSCFLCADGSAIVGFVRDITKPREHEAYLVNYGARKDAILDMVAQNLSTPL